MDENGPEVIVEYGRVGQSSTTHRYPLGRWNSLYKSKIRKGYKDITEFRLEEASIDFTTITDNTIESIVVELQALANKSVQRNYTVSSEAVTQTQVAEAQKLLDELAYLITLKRLQEPKFDSTLLDLYQVIPRRMKDVKHHLLPAFKANNTNLNLVIASEQATLDVMKGQVRVNTVKQDNKQDDSRTILDAMGLDIQLTNPDDIEAIKKELGQIQDKYSRSFKVVNNRTQESFNKWVEYSKNKDCKLFWHGSRNENWWSIIDGGLVLRPTNAVITGAMYGAGLYSADKARKSLGYTSIRGSYWARGSANKGFMALFNVHLGNQYKAKKHEYWMSQLNYKKLKELGDYDSFFAEGGADLRNNEFIVYREEQMTIQYLVEIS